MMAWFLSLLALCDFALSCSCHWILVWNRRILAWVFGQKNPRAHKNKIGTRPPPQTQNTPPPKTRNFMDMGFSCRKNALFPGVHKIGAAISGPRTADTNFMDTRIFLIWRTLSEFAGSWDHPSPDSSNSETLNGRPSQRPDSFLGESESAHLVSSLSVPEVGEVKFARAADASNAMRRVHTFAGVRYRVVSERFTHTYIHACIHTYIHTYIHMHVYIYTSSYENWGFRENPPKWPDQKVLIPSLLLSHQVHATSRTQKRRKRKKK